MNYIKLIRSDEEHEEAMDRLLALMELDPEEGSRESDDLELLAFLIEEYEKEHFPINLPDPIEAIRFRMDQQGLRNKDLIPYLGSAAKVTEVLNGTRRLSTAMIRRLSDGLSIAVEVLIQAPKPVEVAVKAPVTEWDASQFPLAEMHKRGYFSAFKGGLSELRAAADEQLRLFLGSLAGGVPQAALLRSSAQQSSNAKEADPMALLAWQVKVLQQAQAESLPAYREGCVTQAWMRQLVQLSWSEQGPQLAKEYLNQHGIHLIFEPHLPKTYLDGAAYRQAGGHPVIALTLRYERVDNFWFTLLHEMAHVALHLDGDESWFVDDLHSGESVDQREQEADELAQRSLLPIEEEELLAVTEFEEVEALARS